MVYTHSLTKHNMNALKISQDTGRWPRMSNASNGILPIDLLGSYSIVYLTYLYGRMILLSKPPPKHLEDAMGHGHVWTRLRESLSISRGFWVCHL